MRHCASLILIGVAVVECAILRSADETAALAHAYERAELEDERFLTASWHALDNDLTKLQRIAEPPISDLQLSATPLKEHAGAKKKPEDAAVPSNILKALPAGLRSKLGGEAKAAVGKMMLAPMLEMLKGLYQEQKGRITKINKQEEKSKVRYADQEKRYKTRQAEIEAGFKKGKVSEGFYHNETKDNDREFNYWKRCRERNHRQFHNSLKLTHATMDKEKTMMKAYDEALAAPLPTKQNGAQALAKIAQDTGMPEIVLAQLGPAVSQFCRSSLAEVHNAINELAMKGRVRQ